jgi:hypothetical protein
LGELVSAGMLPLYNIFVGIEVAASILTIFLALIILKRRYGNDNLLFVLYFVPRRTLRRCNKKKPCKDCHFRFKIMEFSTFLLLALIGYRGGWSGSDS